MQYYCINKIFVNKEIMLYIKKNKYRIVYMKNIEKKNKAIQICLESKETLTPNRITILELLLDSEAPISAYDLSTKLKNRGKNINISTIYRVIDFWIKLKIVHKISCHFHRFP